MSLRACRMLPNAVSVAASGSPRVGRRVEAAVPVSCLPSNVFDRCKAWYPAQCPIAFRWLRGDTRALSAIADAVGRWHGPSMCEHERIYRGSGEASLFSVVRPNPVAPAFQS